jgi:hypothetical protein
MTINKRSKGRRIEKLAKDLLRNEGYLVETKNASRFQSDDFWGMFDILAVMPDTGELRMIQIKSNASHFYKARKEITDWAIGNGVTGFSCEVWLKENRKDWRYETIKVI